MHIVPDNLRVTYLKGRWNKCKNQLFKEKELEELEVSSCVSQKQSTQVRAQRDFCCSKMYCAIILCSFFFLLLPNC